jgi:hypothetical protein
VVMQAVANRALCTLNKLSHLQPLQPGECDDMAAVEAQLQAAKDLEAYLAGQPGGDWLRIASSATEARQIINSGRMAMVLGIEADELFGCGANVTCSDAWGADRLDHFHGLGVRHVFPVHVYDNGFGGAALYDDLFDFANRLMNGRFFDRGTCPPVASGPGYGYKEQVPTGFGACPPSATPAGSPARAARCSPA